MSCRSLMLQYFSENRPDTMVVMLHDIFSKFYGCPVAIDSFSIDELFQQNPHNFGLLFRMFGLLKQFFDGGYADIVAVINFGHSQPFDELVQSNFHLVFFYNTQYFLRIVFDFFVEAPKEHAQQIGVGIASLSLLNRLYFILLDADMLKWWLYLFSQNLFFFNLVLYFFAPQLQLSAHFGRRCTILEIVKLGDDDWNLLWLGKILFVKAGVVEGEWGKACNLWYIMLMIEKIDEWVVETLWQLHLPLLYVQYLTVLIIIIIDSLTYKSCDQGQLTQKGPKQN